MRTLHVINGLGTGGAERSIAELLPRLRERGIEPIVATFLDRREGVGASVSGHTEVITIPGDAMPARIRGLRRLIRERSPDLLHTSIFEADVAGRLAGIGGPPVLTSLVNTSYDAIRSEDSGVRPGRLRAARIIDAVTARHLTSHFHAITEAVAMHAHEHLSIATDRITVIPRGRDPHRLGRAGAERRREARAGLGLADSVPVILNVGRQEFQKGQTDLLDAVALLRERIPDLVCLIAGRRGNRSDVLCERVERLGLGRSVRFLGHRDDVPELLAAADVFAFPSRYEGLGGAVLEAMALEVPVVASDVRALREVLDDGRAGLLVPPGSGSELAAAIARILAGEQAAKERVAHARRRFSANYTLDRVAGRMATLFERVATEGRR